MLNKELTCLQRQITDAEINNYDREVLYTNYKSTISSDIDALKQFSLKSQKNQKSSPS